MIGDDDDVVVNMTLSLLDQDHQMGQPDKRLDPKDMQVYLTGRDLNYQILFRFPRGSYRSLCSGALATPFVSSGHTYRYPTRADLRETGREAEEDGANPAGIEVAGEDPVFHHGTPCSEPSSIRPY